MAPELHIASLVVHAPPARAARVEEALLRIPGAEVHARTDNGKLVVTLEADTAQAMNERVAQIQRIAGVLSAALIYQCSDTLQAMNEEMPDAQA